MFLQIAFVVKFIDYKRFLSGESVTAFPVGNQQGVTVITDLKNISVVSKEESYFFFAQLKNPEEVLA